MKATKKKASVLSLLAVLAVASVACSPAAHDRRNDGWRHPSAANACTSDEQCMGGTCVVPQGATQGQCSAGSQPAVPPHPGHRPARGDAGAPGPVIQPGPNDIQL